jgi:osmotically-inducible protein OsmY
VDRSIRLQLGKLFAQEPDLKRHSITFDVENGNVTLKGDVDSEVQRRKARDIAMDIPGVRSVANAVRVSE